jgi:hypothetical protein
MRPCLWGESQGMALIDNVQDIVYSKNGHDIVNSKLCGFVFYDAVT